MQYGLRTNIHPDTWRDFLPELIRFCHEAHIDEVLLSEESYEIATVVQSEAYFHRVADAYCEIVPLLKAEGLIPSVYIKVSMGHYEGYVQGIPVFSPFVGEDLTPSPAAPCGMDPAWQGYISRICADCARAGFSRLYLDDDFRSDNHFQGRAGCFCDLHAQATSARCGLPLTQKRLRDHVCGNGEEDLRVRQAWMDVNFENQLQTGRMVEAAVHAVDPAVQIGLMCCADGSSSYQGRDLPRLLRAFAGEGRALLARPAGGAYSDVLLDGVCAMYLGTARTLSACPGELIAVSEVDSYPRTVMSKSVRQTDVHIQLHALTGCGQVTLNLFDHFETPFRYCPEYTALLRDRRALYDRVQALRAGRRPDGVHFLWSWEISRHIDNRSGTVRGLYPHSTLADPAAVMARMGVPIAFGEGAIHFVDGDVVRCLSDEDVARLVRKPLLLDLFAAIELCGRGFGADIGLQNPSRLDEACYERFDVPGFDGGCPGQYVAAYGRNVGDERNRPALFDAAPGAFAASHLIDRAKRPFAPAVHLYENRHGARVCVFAAAIVPDRNWLYGCRAGQVRAILRWLTRGQAPWMVEGGMNVMPIVLRGEHDTLVALLNPSLDDAPRVRLDGPSALCDALTGERLETVSVPAMSLRYVLAT